VGGWRGAEAAPRHGNAALARCARLKTRFDQTAVIPKFAAPQPAGAAAQGRSGGYDRRHPFFRRNLKKYIDYVSHLS
jgi:hypothetical protein